MPPWISIERSIIASVLLSASCAWRDVGRCRVSRASRRVAPSRLQRHPGYLVQVNPQVTRGEYVGKEREMVREEGSSRNTVGHMGWIEKKQRHWGKRSRLPDRPLVVRDAKSIKKSP